MTKTMTALIGLAVAAVSATASASDGPAGKVHPSLRARMESGDPVKAWVLFSDKGVSSDDLPAAIADVTRAYDPRAVARRRLRRTDPGLFDARDLPVAPAYVAEVLATGAVLRAQSRWANAVSVLATPEEIRAIATLPFVRGLQPIRAGLGHGPVHRPAAAAPAPEGFYGLSEEQLEQINLIALHEQGFTGQGVVVGVLDTGFIRTHQAFHHPQHPLVVVAERDFVNDDGNTAPEPSDPPGQADHGTMILGTLGAYAPGSLVGGAYDASFILCKTEDISSETPVEEDNYVEGLEFIEANGGDMATASLIYIDWYTQSQLNGLTAITTIGVNTATVNGVYCCNAAGNMGHDGNPATSHLGAPADALKVLTVGAVSSEGSIVGFSSDGPSADGRVKPELLARGADTWTIDPGSNTQLTTASGTSLATPLVAAGVACLIEARPSWSVDQMRTILFARASDFVANGTHDPLFIRGYGIMNAAGAAAGDCNGNGVLDSQDIQAGTSRDCNANTIPDECECRADFNTDGQLTIADFGAFQSAFVGAHPCADFNGSGTHTIADFGAFQAAFVAGCP